IPLPGRGSTSWPSRTRSTPSSLPASRCSTSTWPRMATSDRQLVALLGHPVANSLSPRMQNAAFAAAGLNWEYVLRDVLPEELEAAVHEVEFANVTTPYKLDVARIVGSDLPSVNTIVRGRGFSTDAAVLEQVTNCYKPAIVGDGGAATAFRQA